MGEWLLQMREASRNAIFGGHRAYAPENNGDFWVCSGLSGVIEFYVPIRRCFGDSARIGYGEANILSFSKDLPIFSGEAYE